MSKFKKALIFSSCLFVLAGCADGGKDAKAKGSMRDQGPVPVGIFTAKMADEPIVLEYPARVVSDQDVDIVAKISGTIEAQNFKAGDKIKKGDELFLIEPDKYEAAYEMAVANLSLANANLEKARLDYNRASRLKRSNSISQQEFDAASAAYNSALASIKSSEAAQKNAAVDMNYTKVIAPFSGVVGDPYVDVGEFVSPGANAKLVRLTKLDIVNAEFAIPDIDALTINNHKNGGQWVQNGSLATLKVGDREYNGTITFIDRVLDEKTGSIAAKASFENKDGSLLPDSFARVRMDGLYQKDGFKIPQVAVMQDLSDSFVYVIEDGSASKKIVKVVSETGEYSIVSSGLNDGDKVIIDNLMKVRVGTPVQIVQEVK